MVNNNKALTILVVIKIIDLKIENKFFCLKKSKHFI